MAIIHDRWSLEKSKVKPCAIQQHDLAELTMSISLMGTIDNTCMEKCTLDGGPVKTTKEKLKKAHLYHIQPIPKWRPVYNSFIRMLVSPLCLIFASKFFRILHMLKRQRGLIYMDIKE